MPQTILIVEDHTDTRDALAKLLEYSGYQVVTAEDGQQGFEQACAQSPDLILADIFMPVMDGIEMIKQLRARPDCGKTPILVLSGYGNKALEAARAGATDVMGKPVDPSFLLETIKSLILIDESVQG